MQERAVYDKAHTSVYEWKGKDESGHWVPAGAPLNQFLEKRLREKKLIRGLTSEERRNRKYWTENAKESATRVSLFKKEHPLKGAKKRRRDRV